MECGGHRLRFRIRAPVALRSPNPKAEPIEWDAVERDLRVLLDGIAGANRNRKHRLGMAVLSVYKFLGVELPDPRGKNTHLRPYFEAMKRAYMKNRRTRGKAATSPPPPGTAAGSSD